MEKERNWKLIVVSIVVTLATLAGCGKKQEEPPTQADTPAAPGKQASPPTTGTERQAAPAVEKPVTLTQVLALWNRGETDAAVEHFLSLKWDAANVLGDSPVMILSERRLVALHQSERQPIVQEAMELTGALRGLVKQVLAAGDQALASGDAQTARTHFTAVLRCAQSLSQPE